MSHFIPNQPYKTITNPININSVEKKIVTRNVSVDSFNRSNHKAQITSDFTYTFPVPINNVLSMKISSIEVPYVWYSFSSAARNNEFTFNIYNISGDVIETLDSTTVIIPDGNYSSSQLTLAMNNYLHNLGTNSLANSVYSYYNYLYFDIEETSAKVLFRTKSESEDTIYNNRTLLDFNPNVIIEIDFRLQDDMTRPIWKNVGWMLGFKEERYQLINLENPVYDFILNYQGISQFNWYLKSEATYGGSLINYLFVYVDDYQKNVSTNHFMYQTPNSYIGDNVMGRMQVITGYNTILTNNNSDCVFKKREYFGPVRLEKLHIKLLDKNGDVIDLNGNEFSFLLEIEQLYSQ